MPLTEVRILYGAAFLNQCDRSPLTSSRSQVVSSAIANSTVCCDYIGGSLRERFADTSCQRITAQLLPGPEVWSNYAAGAFI